ncbi:hypothetical protein [Lacticaseibacillus jixiensis]|uniref:hypothetical protein n=1 Tax=Lacticaseibacillus jixiensis TaxID=3231926 RepID=UPI0036F3868F
MEFATGTAFYVQSFDAKWHSGVAPRFWRLSVSENDFPGNVVDWLISLELRLTPKPASA